MPPGRSYFRGVVGTISRLFLISSSRSRGLPPAHKIAEQGSKKSDRRLDLGCVVSNAEQGNYRD